MKRSGFIAVALVALALACVGCSSSSDEASGGNPFTGSWRIVAYGAEVTFDNRDYTITLPGLGTFTGAYSYQGDYPDFVATLSVRGREGSTLVNVHFTSEDRFVAAEAGDPATSSAFERI